MNAEIKSKKVALVIPHLGPGGAQRVVATSANALAEEGIETHVITILDDRADAYKLNPRVCRHRVEPKEKKGKSTFLVNGLNSSAPQSRKLERLKGPIQKLVSAAYLRQIVLRPLGVAHFGLTLGARARWLRCKINAIEPDAVLSFLTQTNILTILATRGLGVRTVVSERNDPRLQKLRRRVVFLRNLLYPCADVVTANTYGALKEMESFIPKADLAFLPNPIRSYATTSSACLAGPTFVTVTRLVEQKGVDVLLKAAAQAFEHLPKWRLAIVGDGPLCAELKLLANELGIEARVDWYGYIADPIALVRAADVFILTSRFEGSPNALLEAMACGLPSIISDASPGPTELLGTQAGLIVPTENIDATAQAMITLAQDQQMRKKMGAAAFDRSRVHQLDNAMQVWRDLLRI
jgi:glycosyltransferase involved in cell wall biosynthesis